MTEYIRMTNNKNLKMKKVQVEIIPNYMEIIKLWR